MSVCPRFSPPSQSIWSVKQRELLADEIDHADVPAGAELEFHAGEAGLHGAGDGGEQSSIESIWSKVGPTSTAWREVADQWSRPADRRQWRTVPFPPREELVERAVLQPGLEVPPGRIQRRLGELVAAEAVQPLRQVLAAWRSSRRPRPGRASRAGAKRPRRPIPGRSRGRCRGWPRPSRSPRRHARPPARFPACRADPAACAAAGASGRARWKISIESMCMVLYAA